MLAKNYPAEKSSIVIKVTNSTRAATEMVIFQLQFMGVSLKGIYIEREMYVYINIKGRTLVCGLATNGTSIILNHFSIIVSLCTEDRL